MVKTEIECWGKVEDLPSDDSRGWADGDEAEWVQDTLVANGFRLKDVEEFMCFLVKTETGDYTEIYGIKKSIPYNWEYAYQFKVDGKVL